MPFSAVILCIAAVLAAVAVGLGLVAQARAARAVAAQERAAAARERTDAVRREIAALGLLSGLGEPAPREETALPDRADTRRDTRRRPHGPRPPRPAPDPLPPARP